MMLSMERYSVVFTVKRAVGRDLKIDSFTDPIP